MLEEGLHSFTKNEPKNDFDAYANLVVSMLEGTFKLLFDLDYKIIPLLGKRKDGDDKFVLLGVIATADPEQVSDDSSKLMEKMRVILTDMASNL